MNIQESARWTLRTRFYDLVIFVQVLMLTAKLEILKGRKALPELAEDFTPRTISRHPSRDGFRRLVVITDWILSRLYHSDFCMPRSFVLLYLMRKYGYGAEIHFGVARHEGVLRGHAWVELGGAPINEVRNPRGAYTPVYSYPSPIHPKTSEVAA